MANRQKPTPRGGFSDQQRTARELRPGGVPRTNETRTFGGTVNIGNKPSTRPTEQRKGDGILNRYEKLATATSPGGIQYWYDKDDPNWVYLKNDRKSQRYPLAWVLGKATNPPTADRTKRTGEGKQREITAAALGNKVAIIYGQDRVAGDVFWGPRLLSSNECVVGYAHGEGECTEMVKVELDDKTVAFPAGPYGVNVAHTFYPGVDAPPAADPWFLASTANAAVERYPGLAYTAMLYTYADLLPKTIEPLFTVKGVKMLDPRLGVDINGNPNQPKAWSDNPILCLADYMSNMSYGWRAGVSGINWASVADIANWCDADVGGRKRFTFNMTFRRGADPLEIIDTIRDHFRCAWNVVNGKITFYVDRAADPIPLTLDEAVNCKALRRKRTPTRNIPGRVIYRWIDPARKYEDVPTRDAFSLRNERVAEYNGDGCRNGGQALSQANYHYKKRISAALHGALEVVRAVGIKLEIYDVVPTNLPSLGLPNGFLIRITSKAIVPDGTYLIEWERYSADVFGESSAPAQTLPATDLPKPNDPPPVVENLALEELLLSSDVPAGSMIKVTFDPPSGYPFYKFTRVKAQRTVAGVAEPAYLLGEVTAGPLYIAPADIGASYVVTAETVNLQGRASAVVSAGPFTPVGKTTAPKPVVMVAAAQIGSRVQLYWQPSDDRSVVEFEVRRGPTTGTYATATRVARVSTREVYDDPPIGTWRFWVVALDYAGNPSEERYFDIAVFWDGPDASGEIVVPWHPYTTQQSIEGPFFFGDTVQLNWPKTINVPLHAGVYMEGLLTGKYVFYLYTGGVEAVPELVEAYGATNIGTPAIDEIMIAQGYTCMDEYEAQFALPNQGGQGAWAPLIMGVDGGLSEIGWQSRVIAGDANGYRNADWKFHASQPSRAGDPAAVTTAGVVIPRQFGLGNWWQKSPAHIGQNGLSDLRFGIQLSTNSPFAQEYFTAALNGDFFRYSYRQNDVPLGVYDVVSAIQPNNDAEAIVTLPNALPAGQVPTASWSITNGSLAFVDPVLINNFTLRLRTRASDGTALAGVALRVVVTDTGRGGSSWETFS